MQFIVQPRPNKRLGEFLVENLQRDWDVFRAAIAFVKRSGTRHITSLLRGFSGSIELVCGIDHKGSSKEGLQDLLDNVNSRGSVIVFHNQLPFTFHPKTFLFRNAERAEVLIGSGNLTQGGLYTNYEAGIQISLEVQNADHKRFLQQIETALDNWARPNDGTALNLTGTSLAQLVAKGYVPPEVLVEAVEAAKSGTTKEKQPTQGTMFAGVTVPQAPSGSGAAKGTQARRTATPMTRGNTGFVMTLQKTDVGTGQTSPGTSRRSPEIFIPLSARDANPDFWGWPAMFEEDQNRPGKFDRLHVPMRLGPQLISVNMMTWPVKHDFRLRNEALRSAGNIGDIIRIEKIDAVDRLFDYYVEVVPRGTTQFSTYEDICQHPVKSSKKRFGYY